MPNVSNINGAPLSSVSSIAGVAKGSLSAFNGVALETTYDLNVFLVGGQSNSDGRVDISLGPAYIQDGVLDNVYSFYGQLAKYDLNSVEIPDREWGDGKYAFNNVALDLIGGVLNDVTAVQVTVGGSVLYAQASGRGCWNPVYDNIPTGTRRLLQELEYKYKAFEAWANNNALNVKVRGLIWHQGESDDFSPADTDYLTNWTALVSKVRTFVGDPNMPVYYGTIPSTSANYNATIRAAMLSFAASDPNAYCRDNDDLTFFDGVHFDAASCNTFGEWVYNTYLSIA